MSSLRFTRSGNVTDACALLLTGSLFLLVCGCDPHDGPAPYPSAPPLSASDSMLLHADTLFNSDPSTVHKYKFISEEPAQDGSRSMMRAKILVPPDLSRADLEANIRSAAKDISDRHKIDSMLLFANKPGTDLDGQYSAGRLELTPGENGAEPTVTVDLSDFYFASKDGEIPISKEDQPTLDAVKRKFNEKQRRAIYFETGKVEDRGLTEAKEQVPDPAIGEADAAAKLMHQTGIANDLQEKYRHQLARKKGLTDKQLEAIGFEGTTNNWPSPE